MHGGHMELPLVKGQEERVLAARMHAGYKALLLTKRQYGEGLAVRVHTLRHTL